MAVLRCRHPVYQQDTAPHGPFPFQSSTFISKLANIQDLCSTRTGAEATEAAAHAGPVRGAGTRVLGPRRHAPFLSSLATMFGSRLAFRLTTGSVLLYCTVRACWAERLSSIFPADIGPKSRSPERTSKEGGQGARHTAESCLCPRHRPVRAQAAEAQRRQHR